MMRDGADEGMWLEIKQNQNALRNYFRESFHMQKTAQIFSERSESKTHTEKKACVEDKWPCPGMRSTSTQTSQSSIFYSHAPQQETCRKSPKGIRWGDPGVGGTAQKRRGSERGQQTSEKHYLDREST